jgi:hypothetical protein
MISGSIVNVPILFIIFNRPDTTFQVFEAIRDSRPTELFIAADGPRCTKDGEVELCREARTIVDNVDWDCTVHTLFRTENLGCKVAVSSAIDWFFSHVEAGIILEDDCLPNASFFLYCQQMLDRFKEDERIFMISGDNFQNGVWRGDGDYYFSIYGHIWGWATWKRAWKKYDVTMADWEVLKNDEKFNSIFSGEDEAGFWKNIFTAVSDGKVDTWDYQWIYTGFKHRMLSVMPNENLVKNIGFGINATHTRDVANPYSNMTTHSLQIQNHPTSIAADVAADAYTYKSMFNPDTHKRKKNWSMVRELYHLIKSKINI